MKKTKKALATLAIAGMTLSMIPFNAFAASTVPTRIMGMTAEQTATKIADQTGYTGTAILASSTSYGMVDALTAGPLAASLKAPILLTGAGNTLNADTKAELTKLAVKKVYVTSGTAVIKQGVIDELKAMGIEVIALGGFDRAETSVNIAKQMTGVTKVAVANGVPDALSIASVASAANQPILLTNKNALPSSVADYLASAGVTSTDVIGGTGVISDAVVAGLPGATRHFGMTAYDTNNQVIQDFASALEFDNIYVANGQTGIDALAGAPLAAQTKSAIVLTDGKTVPAVAAFTHGKNASAVVTALGGTAVVPEAVRMGVAAGNVSTPVGDLAIVAVSSLTDDGHVLSVEFNKAFTGPVNKSMVSIFNTNNLSRVGVESVELSSDGKSLEVTLFDTANNDEIVRLTEYTITVGSLKTNFTRSGYMDKDTNNAYISSVDSGERELVISYTGGSKILEVPDSINIDFQEALGQDIKVWYDGKDNVLNYVYESDSVLYDAAEVTTSLDISEAKGKLNLVGADKKYDISPDVILFVNGEEVVDLEAALENGDAFDYAKVVLNGDGDVVRIYAFIFTEDPLVVKSVDESYIISYDGEELDLDDYIIVKDGKEISVLDINDGDLVFFNEDAYDNDGFAVVYNITVSGEIENVFLSSFDIDGKNYSYGDAYYLDGDNDKDDLDIDAAEELQAGGDVVVYFDFKGDVVVVKGETVAVSSAYSDAILTEAMFPYKGTKSDAPDMLEITSVDSESNESVNDFKVSDLDEIILQGENDEFVFEVGEDLPANADESTATAVDLANDDIEIDEFVLEQVSDTTTYNIVAYNDGGDVLAVVKQIVKNADSTDNLLQINKDDNGNVVGLKFFDSEFSNAEAIDYDDNYVDGYRLQDSTVVINIDAFDTPGYADDDSDVAFQTWADVKASGADIPADSLVYVNDAGYVTHILTTDFEAGETSSVSALITRLDINSDDKIVRIHALVAGEEVTYTADKLTNEDFFEGTVAVLTVNDNSGVVTEITAAANRIAAGTVTDVNVSKDEVTVNLIGGGTVTFILSSNTAVYDATDSDGDDFTVEALRDIEEGDSVVVLRSAANSRFVNVLALINDAADYVAE